MPTMSTIQTVVLVPCLILLASLTLMTLYVRIQEAKHSGAGLQERNTSVERSNKIWVTLSLCYGENVKDMGARDSKPYHLAAIYSARLWLQLKNPNIEVLVIVVYNDWTADVRDYKAELEQTGAKVVMQRNMIEDCPLQAKVVRLFAFEFGFIKEKDIILPFDTDGFPIGEALLESFNRPYFVWVLNMHIVEKFHCLIPVSGTAMRKETWKLILNFQHLGIQPTMKETVRYFRVRFRHINKWYLDEICLSFGLLYKQYQRCSLPTNNELWKFLGIPPKEIRDSRICYHGHYVNCENADMREVTQKTIQNCTWYHFYPHHGEADFEKMFNIIQTSRKTDYLSPDVVKSQSFKI